MPVRVFVSHSSKDGALGREIVQLLRDAFGLESKEIFFSTADRTGVQPGRIFEEAIAQALREAAVVIVLVSPNFLESEFCLCELGAVWFAKPEALQPIAVPPLRRDRLSGVLRGREARDLVEQIDVIERDIEQALHAPAETHFRDRLPRLKAAAALPAKYPPLNVLEDIHFETHYPDADGRLVSLDADTIAELKAIAGLSDCFDQEDAFTGWDRALHRVFTSDAPSPGFGLKLVLFEGTLTDPALRIVAQATTLAQSPKAHAAVNISETPHVFVESGQGGGWEPVPTGQSGGCDSILWEVAPGTEKATPDRVTKVVVGRPSASLMGRRLRMLVGAHYPGVPEDPNLFFWLNTHRGVKPDGITRYQFFRAPGAQGVGYVRRLFSFPRQHSGFEVIEGWGLGARHAEPDPSLAVDDVFLSRWGRDLLAPLVGDRAEFQVGVSTLVSAATPALQFWIDNARDGRKTPQGPGLRDRNLLVFYRRPV